MKDVADEKWAGQVPTLRASYIAEVMHDCAAISLQVGHL